MKAAERQPLGHAYLFGGVYAKEMLIPDAGTLVPTHSHNYDHLSYVAAGAVRVWQDGDLIGDFEAPAGIRIPAHKKHTIQALVPMSLVLCLHSVALGEADFHEGDLVHEEHHLVEEAA